MIVLTYDIILKVLLFAGALFTGAAWMDHRGSADAPIRRVGMCRLLRVPAVRIFAGLVLGLTLLHALSVAAHWTGLWFGHAQTPYGPWRTPLFPFLGFHDLGTYYTRILGLRSGHFWNPVSPDNPSIPVAAAPWMYPPAGVFPYLLVCFKGFPIQCWVVLSAVLLSVMVLGFGRWLMGRGVQPLEAYGLGIFSLLLSYPFWIEISSGNIELFAFVLIAAAILLYLRGRITSAAIMLGLAVSFKIFPFVYFGLFLARRQHRQIVYGAVTAIAANVVALRLMGPSMLESLRMVREGLAFNRQTLILYRQPLVTAIDHSLFGFVKQIVFVLAHGRSGVTPPVVLSVYMVVAAVLGIVLYFVWIQRLPLLNQVLALCVASILLPPTSHDYTLIHLYVPWVLLVGLALRAARDSTPVAGLVPAMACFACLFTTSMEIILRGDSFGGQFKCVVLAVLLYVSLRYSWPDAAERPPAPAPMQVPIAVTA